MNKLVVRSLAFQVFFSLHCYAQYNRLEIEDTRVDPPVFLNSGKRSLNTDIPIEAEKDEIALFKYSIDFLHPEKTIREDLKSNIVRSFRSNIRFGGFGDKYVIVNYTPEMNIQPSESISIYAHHNLSYFIPMRGLKEHFKLMVIQSAAILAIDNTVKFLIPAKGMLNSIVNFALKNVVLHYMLNSVTGSGKEKIHEFGYYYYSISVRF
ncbi:MAG: hypothetical protein K8I03_11590 [Ignavibacteria bacterium]|nr:hypothetical protein [Ignavibacteria bacterium]